MLKYSVTVSMTRKIEVYAKNEDEAEDKAVETVIKWNGILDAESVDVEEI